MTEQEIRNQAAEEDYQVLIEEHHELINRK